VVLEPSCASVFRDELTNLMPGRVEAERLKQQTKLLSELLADEQHVPTLHRKAIVQGHCHHKSVLGYEAEGALHERMGLDAELLASGCCGMAGSFGFEDDPSKQQVTKALGERVLFPALRKAAPDSLIIADGFSCRTQIEQGTGRRALHSAEVLALALDYGPEGPPLEVLRADGKEEARRQDSSMAGVLVLAGVAAAAGLLVWNAYGKQKLLGGSQNAGHRLARKGES